MIFRYFRFYNYQGTVSKPKAKGGVCFLIYEIDGKKYLSSAAVGDDKIFSKEVAKKIATHRVSHYSAMSEAELASLELTYDWEKGLNPIKEIESTNATYMYMVNQLNSDIYYAILINNYNMLARRKAEDAIKPAKSFYGSIK